MFEFRVMSGFGIVSLTDLPATNSEGINSYEYHYCSPIYSSHHQAIFRHPSPMPDIHTENHSGCPEDNSFWSNSPRSDSPSPASTSINYIDSVSSPHSQQHGYYQLYTQLPFPNNEISGSYKSENGYMEPHTLLPLPMDELNRTYSHGIPGVGIVRGVKRRNTANKKERRRTQSINAAFQYLRERIPNIPADSKLSKIKTLRLATSYISYLTSVLETDAPAVGFRAELTGNIHGRRSVVRDSAQSVPMDCSATQGQGSTVKQLDNSHEEGSSPVLGSIRKAKGRTGWPQHVWALELKQEQNL